MTVWDAIKHLASHDAGSAALAGALGGIVRWATLRHNWREGATALVVGAICAVYLGPLVTPILTPIIGAIAPNGEADGFASFIVGLGGISLSGFVIDIFTRERRKLGGDDDRNP